MPTFWQVEKGLTSLGESRLAKEVFAELDKNNDGEVSYKELIVGVKRFMEPSTRIKAAQKKKALAELKRVEDDKKKTMQVRAHRRPAPKTF